MMDERKPEPLDELQDEALEMELGLLTPDKSWPTFVEGETFELKGVTFEVQRLNASSLVLRPVVEDMSAREVIGLLRKAY